MAFSPKRALRFSNLRLENWRNFVRVDVAMQGRAFLVGPNAAGKSNFLDSLRFLHDLARDGGGLQESVTRRGGVSKVRCLAARRNSNVTIAVTIADEISLEEWDYSISFSQDKQRRLHLKREIVKRDGIVVLDRPDDDREDPERLRETHLEQVNVNRQFRAVAEHFRSVQYLHLVPQLVREPERFLGKGSDPFGSDFLEQVARTPERTRGSRLRRIGEALKIAIPQLSELQFSRDDVGRPRLRGRYEHWRRQGAWQSEEQFSDGTLRLLALLWVILDGSGPLLLEEPEQSLHPDVVRFLPSMFANMQRRTGRQVILSSHSADLLRDEGIGLDEVLLLNPTAEGTRVEVATTVSQARELLQGGVPLPDIVLPHTRPRSIQQLALFGD